MRIEIHEPWKKGMSITYQALCNKFKEVKTHKTSSEQLMMKEIESLFSAFKDSLAMPVRSYTKMINQHGAIASRQSEQVERVTYQIAHQVRDNISQCVVDENSQHGVMFDVNVGIGCDSSLSPEATITLKCKISPSNGGMYNFTIEEQSFLFYPSSATNRFDEICSAMKWSLASKLDY